MECDIERIWIHVDDPSLLFGKLNVRDTLYNKRVDNESGIVITEEGFRSITWEAFPTAVVESYPVFLTTTPGATVYIFGDDGVKRPFSNGTVVDFANEKKTVIEVISEDKAWSKQYELSMINLPKGTFEFGFDFNEEYEYYQYSKTKMGVGYFKFKPQDPRAQASLFYNPDDPYWKNGNPGFAMSRGTNATPEQYPTTVGFSAGPDGSDCALLQTLSTGGLGAMAKIYIAAGSLFNGEFDPAKALKSRSAARLATQFGTPVDHKPLSMTVDLKYVPGPDYWDENKNVLPGIVDEPDAYVVFFRNDVPGGKLDGTNVLTHPNIIGKARLKHRYNADGTNQETGSPIHGVTAEWQTFKLELEYTSEPDPEVLKNLGYSIVIGFSSGWQGADFRGALDSKFYIDNIFIEMQKNEDDENEEVSNE